MSVTNDATIRRRPLPYRNDPTLPESVWYAQGAVIGDVSGGFAEVNIILNPGGTIRSGRSWSLETCLLTQNNNSATREGRIRTQNLDVIGPSLQNPILKAFIMLCEFVSANIGAPESATNVRDIHPRLYLGTQGSTALAATIETQWSNEDGITMGVYMTGYEWSAQAISVGARRPIDGLLG